MPRDSVSHTFFVATALCVACSILVAGAAVGLRPLQQENKLRDKRKNILLAAALFDAEDGITAKQIESLYDERISSRIVDLDSGETVVDLGDGIDDEETERFMSLAGVAPLDYDERAAAQDPMLSGRIVGPVDKAEGAPRVDEGVFVEDVANIRRRPHYSFVYLVKDGQGQIEQVILPISGKGLWSTLYGFISLDADLNTVRGITFYEHGETPGLGGEVDNPSWKAQWEGKEVFDEEGEVAIDVYRGEAPDDDPHGIDGISGATITSIGVENTIAFWLGPGGFKPFLDRLRQQLQSQEGNRG